MSKFIVKTITCKICILLKVRRYGTWLEWTAWSSCSSTCTGIETRQRLCDPSNNMCCEGSDTETKECFNNHIWCGFGKASHYFILPQQKTNN